MPMLQMESVIVVSQIHGGWRYGLAPVGDDLTECRIGPYPQTTDP